MEISARAFHEISDQLVSLRKNIGSDYCARWLRNGPRDAAAAGAQAAIAAGSAAQGMLELLRVVVQERTEWEASQTPQPVAQPAMLTVTDNAGRVHMVPNPQYRGPAAALTPDERALLDRLSKRHGWAPQEAA